MLFGIFSNRISLLGFDPMFIFCEHQNNNNKEEHDDDDDDVGKFMNRKFDNKMK